MTPKAKYKKCLDLLGGMKQIIHGMIETGIDEGLKPMELLEESLNVVKVLEDEDHKKALKAENKKEREIKKGFYH